MKEKANREQKARHEKREDKKAMKLYMEEEREKNKLKVRTAPEHLLPTTRDDVGEVGPGQLGPSFEMTK